MLETNIRKATLVDADSIFKLIEARIDWMDKHQLRQWNVTNYLERYPLQYFERKLGEGCFFVVEREQKIVGAIALFRHDPRWDDVEPSLYIHHLVTDPMERQIGNLLISFAEKYTRDEGFKYLRLDCQTGNVKINEYYASLGFVFVGSFDEGEYCGNKMQKIVQ